MIRKILHTFILSLLLLGCASDGKINTKPLIQTTTRNSSLEIKLPEHNYIMVESRRQYKSKVIFTRKIYGPDILSKERKNLDKFEDTSLNQEDKVFIENKLSLLKHLNVIGKSVKHADMEHKANESHSNNNNNPGELDSDKKEEPIELIITIVIKRTCTSQSLSIREQFGLYSCVISYQVIELKPNGKYTLLTNEKCQVEGKAKRYRIWSVYWDSEARKYRRYRVQGVEEEDDEKDKPDQEKKICKDIKAHGQAFCRANLQLVNALGKLLPCGGQINKIDLSLNEAKVNTGSKGGIHNNQIFVIYAKENGSPVPLALAEARIHNMSTEIKSDVNRTALKIFKWSSSKSAVEIKKEIKKNSDYVSNNLFYAVSKGLPKVLGTCGN